MPNKEGSKMKHPIRFISLFAVVVIGLLLISGCVSQTTTEETTPTPTGTSRLTPTPEKTSSGGSGITIPGLSDLVTTIPTLVDLVPTRTPAPTATPDAISNAISQIIKKIGISERTLLWLKFADWIDLLISLGIIVLAYIGSALLVNWLLPRLIKRTKIKHFDTVLHASGKHIRWLIVFLFLRLAVNRLIFINSGLKSVILDAIFFGTMFLMIVILWRSIDLAAKFAEVNARKMGQQKEAESLITLIVWVLRFFAILLILTFIFAHYAVNITGFTLFISIIVLVLSIASKDLLADIIAGALILMDHPYRIGDRLELPSIDSWGDVIEIGMRSTKILSMENRMVVIPNSVIAKSQIVNYSYPDPSYLDLLDVLVAYDNDIEQIEQLMEEAILSVEGVVKDRETYTLLMELHETHMLFWAGWWIDSYLDRYSVHGEVSKAIMKKFKDAGVKMPYRAIEHVNNILGSDKK